MEAPDCAPARGRTCPMFCILRTVLFAVVTVFMLFIPLGDPDVQCKATDSMHDKRRAMCYLCEAYFILLQASNRALETMKYAKCVGAELLHEAKLKFYSFLEKVDKRDLCSSVCCQLDPEIDPQSNKIARCLRCRCVRNRCRIRYECD